MPLILLLNKFRETVWGFVAFTGISFGAGGLLVKKFTNDGLDAFTVTWIPFLVGGSIAFIHGMLRKELVLSAVPAGMLLGLFSSLGPSLIFNTGFDRLPAGINTLLISLGPIFTAIVAHFVFADERFNLLKALGLITAYAGVAVLAFSSLDDGGDIVDILLVLGGAAIAGGAGVLTRHLTLRHEPMALMAPNLLIAGLISMILTFSFDLGTRPANGFASWHIPMLFVFGLITYLSFLSILKANQIGTTGQVSVIGYFLPLFGVVGGVIFFNEKVSLSLLMGGVLILLAMGAIARGSIPQLANKSENS
ncbi:MAG: DMT family transporter [Acidimicrobiales bacterium]|nr:DMT family transporter [Acidimicrobiales bacterium]|tara:strand:+ start:2249 stop:3169 length:921 start_codon:yes stop_codon:yes gene_type:complete